ncbi:TPR domain protein [Mucinivorans hirudinis]|uniref:TPR domain protein n=1 Tax=Mucinivorans hirudinis TaxID=1433126 RepID=A0A060R890_9BACT|nr:TPR domain protein [Mucinivorans hirudinis]
MKNRLLALSIAIIAATTLASAQGIDYSDPKYAKYGDTPAEREANILMYNRMDDAFKMKAYDEAINYINTLIERAPKASANLYIRGAEIYRGKLQRSTSKVDRLKYLDSIVIIMDKRIEAFGDHPTQGAKDIRQKKARIFYEFAPAETERAAKYFNEAILEAGNEVDPELVAVYFNMLTESFKVDMITLEDYMEAYQKLTELLKQEPNDNTEKVVGQVEGMFVTSGAANCENIEKLFKPKYDATPDDMDLMRKILGLFDRGKCPAGDFQLAVLEKYYKLDPKPEFAAMLASAYESRQNYTKALEYVQIAIENEKDSKQKANHLMRAVLAYTGMGNHSQAAKLCREVIAIDDTKPLAYLILANAMASGVNQACSDFERVASYWLIVDAYRNALKYFENDPEQTATINKQIAAYTANFPKQEDIFMLGLELGNSYNVNCGWISGRTTIRKKP